MDGSNVPSPAAGDFLAVLKQRRLMSDIPSGLANRPEFKETVATTILGFKFAGGVLVAGDRRATAGNVVMYDRADKVLEIDRHSVMAIAGSPATAWEMARILEHSFQFYRRSQLQEMSVEGKVRALSKLLRDNLGMVMQGVGVVVPLFATYDKKSSDPAKLFFYDAMGAQFEATDFASSGSGASAVRSVLYYEKNWGSKPLRERLQEEAILLALKSLDTAAEADTATGGIDRHGKIFPIIKIVNQTGIETVSDDKLSELFQTHVA
jgi:proteasome beta subunit